MRTGWLIRQLLEIIDLYEIDGQDEERVAALRACVAQLERWVEPTVTIADLNTFDIDPSVFPIVEELIEKGASSVKEQLQRKIPDDVQRMLIIPKLSPRQIGKLYRDLHIDNMDKLEQAVKQQKLRKLSGFGAKVELRIKNSLKQLKNIPDSYPIAFLLPIAEEILMRIRTFQEVKQVEIAGGLRRYEEQMTNIVYVIATEQPDITKQRIIDLPKADTFIADSENGVKITFSYLWPIEMEFHLVSIDDFPLRLLYATGSDTHIEKLLQRAEEMGVQCVTRKMGSEAEFYQQLSLPYLPPEVRFGKDEFERVSNEFPRLIDTPDLKGDLHMHTNWSDGGNSIEEMARAAYARGYHYIAITDHSRSLKIAGGLSIENLLRQRDEIKRVEEKIQKELGDFTILWGVEMEILADGSLDYPDELLRQMDIVIASIHTAFQQDEYTISKRMMDAMSNPHIDIIAHPTGRMIGRREPYRINMELLFKAAQAYGKILELNSNPERLDLKAEYVQEAIENYRIPITINTDAHSVEELNHIEIGIHYAKRGWVEPQHVVNTWPLDELMKYLRRND